MFKSQKPKQAFTFYLLGLGLLLLFILFDAVEGFPFAVISAMCLLVSWVLSVLIALKLKRDSTIWILVLFLASWVAIPIFLLFNKEISVLKEYRNRKDKE